MPQAASGPWEDYKPRSPTKQSSDAAPPWEDYRKPPTAAPRETHGVSGSWTTPDPGALAGMRESAGIPSLAETKAFAKKVPSYVMNPKDSAKRMASSIEEAGKAIYQHPGEFAANLTNVPQIRKSIQEGHYFETAGLGMGTAIQVLSALGETKTLVAKSVQEFRAGYAGKTVEEVAQADKMLREAKVAQATESSRLLKESPSIRLTPGERFKSTKLESVEKTLRGFPGLSGPFDKLARQRTQAIMSFNKAIDDSSMVLRSQAQQLYKAIEARVPGFEATQRQVSDLRDAEFRTKNLQDRRDIGINRKAAEDAAREMVQKSGDKLAVEAWRRADYLYSKHSAQRRVSDVIRRKTEELEPGVVESVGASSREQTIRPRALVEGLKKLDYVNPVAEERGKISVLERAVGRKRADQIQSVASLLDRVSRKDKGYVAERLLGYGILTAIPLFGHSYIWELAAGAAGGRLLEGALLGGFGKTEQLKGFLKAVDAGETRKAVRLANALVDATVAEQNRKATEEAAKARRMAETRTDAPTSPYKVPGEPRSGLRVAEVPVQMEPEPFERPLEDQLGRLVEDLRKEGDEGRELEQHLHDALEEEMEKIRQRSRTQGAMQQYRGR